MREGQGTVAFVLRTLAAENIPGLWDVELTGPGGVSVYYDMTIGQVVSMARHFGAPVERATENFR